jgi:transcriptional regulator with XRE-family HTH domain
MRELAQKAELSQPFLSNIENGRSLPSVSTLYRLADALGVAPPDLLPPRPDIEIEVSRAGRGIATPVDEVAGAALSRLVVGGPGRALEVHRISIEAGQWAGDWFEHEGEDFVHVLAGTLVVELRSGQTVKLGEGDSAWHRSTIPHRWRVGRAVGAEVLLVNTGRAHG